MSTVEKIEHEIEQLPPEDLDRLSMWLDRRRAVAGAPQAPPPPAFRDHRAFLNSYSPEDEGLYDDAARR